MQKQIKIQCPAKVNLTLKVLGKRPDGFHDIDSIMQTISLFDYLTIKVEKSAENAITLFGTSDEIPYDERNLVYKAGKLFLDYAKIDGYKIEVFIDKNIPIAAGLAGGSTDAAGMLYGLNELFGAPLSRVQLHELCAKLGSDLNVCLEGGKLKTSGRGEKVEPMEFEEFEISLIKPENLGISAKEAYTKFSEKQTQNPTPQPPPARGGGSVTVKVNHREISKTIKQNAKNLRNNMTPQEQKLWYYLQRSNLGDIEFRRQQPIDNFVVDFVSLKKRLVIEIDGRQHNVDKEYDKNRDAYLNQQGFEVLHFWNNEIDNNIQGVLESILNKLQDCPRPLREGDRGWGYIPQTREDYVNDLEWAVIDDYEPLQQIKNTYPKSVMSGSGSTYYGINLNFNQHKGFWVKNGLKSIPYGVKKV